MDNIRILALEVLIGVVLYWTTKDFAIGPFAVFACLTILFAIPAITRIRSLSVPASSSTGGLVPVFALLALTTVLLTLTGAAGNAYAAKREKPKPSQEQPSPTSPSLTMNPKVELVSTGKTVNEYRVTGTVSGLGPGETIWVANLAKKEAKAQNIDEQDLAKAKVYPAFGPCIINGQDWRCDKVFMTHKSEDHYVLAYRVPSTDARDLVAYQRDAYSRQPGCQKGSGNFPPIIMPRDAQLKAHVVTFA